VDQAFLQKRGASTGIVFCYAGRSVPYKRSWIEKKRLEIITGKAPFGIKAWKAQRGKTVIIEGGREHNFYHQGALSISSLNREQ